MKGRYALGAAVIALFALPAGASAGQGGQVSELSTQQCAQERADLGGKAFRKRYGERHTMRTCVRRTRGQVAAALGLATADCQTELAGESVTDFIDDYAESDSLDEAMRECVAEGIDFLLNRGDDEVDATDEGE